MKSLRILLVLVVVLLGASLTPLAATGWGTYNGNPIVRLVVNGVEARGDVPAVMLGGRTMIPLRLVAEALGAAVEWDPETYTASVTGAATADYYDWTLSDAEIADAIAWARAGKGHEYWDILPMYLVKVSSSVEFLLFTPWANLVTDAHHILKFEQRNVDLSEFRGLYDGYVTFAVIAYGAYFPEIENVTLTHRYTTITPATVGDPYQQTWGTTYGVIQQYKFDVSQLPRSGPVTLRATVNGQEYVYSWNLDTLK
ncbi:MAG: copper amine oxidase N-terminal domain-containing protein [Bacillota bacterium]|jgi:hypothetical protein